MSSQTIYPTNLRDRDGTPVHQAVKVQNLTPSIVAMAALLNEPLLVYCGDNAREIEAESLTRFNPSKGWTIPVKTVSWLKREKKRRGADGVNDPLLMGGEDMMGMTRVRK